MTQESHTTHYNSRLLFLAALFAGSLAIAAAIGSKLISLFGLTFSATVLAYPITFLVTDIVSEVWGKAAAKKMVLYGFAVTLLAYLLMRLAIELPPFPNWDHQAAYTELFGTSMRIIVGGLIAYVASQLHDIWMFHLIRGATKGKWLWLRNTGSTFISQGIDTAIFVIIAFSNTGAPLLQLFIGQYLIKLAIAVLDTPFAYLGVWWVKRPAAPESGSE